jgi:cytochrome c peroxidase
MMRAIAMPYAQKALVAGIALAGTTSAGVLLADARPPPSDVQAAKKMIVDLLERDEEARGDGTSYKGTLVRLAWHASGTYCGSSKTGGSNGATMRYEPEKSWGANAGLQSARDFLEPVKAQFPSLSYADLWTLAGSTAIEAMGGPDIAWRGGRSDSAKPTTVPDGRLPDADKGSVAGTIAHIRAIFGRMGFSNREMVALIGAHAVGRCHENASGYWGPWTRAETTFSNEYFRLLLDEKWTIKTSHKGAKWTGPEQWEDPSGELMMLPSDMALLFDKDFRSIVELYASNEEIFFKDFAAAWKKLTELGVPFAEPASSIGIGGMLGRLGKLTGLW